MYYCINIVLENVGLPSKNKNVLATVFFSLKTMTNIKKIGCTSRNANTHYNGGLKWNYFK